MSSFRTTTRRLGMAALVAALACGFGLARGAARAQVAGTPPLALNYTDSQGQGCLTLTGLGDDAVSGGSAISVTLVQNGVTFSGQGEEWTTSANTPRTTAISFWLTDDAGIYLYYTGALQMGVDTQNGQGQWTELQDTTITDQWQTFRRFGPGPAPGGCAQA